MLDLGLSLDVWPWLWLVVAVVFILVELTVLGGSFMILPFGVSALIASLLAFSGVSIEIQWGIFAFGGAVLFLVFWRYQTLVQRGNTLPPGVGAVRLRGRIGVVTQAIDPNDTEIRGRVVVDGETWGAMTDGAAVVEEGARVRITDVEGTRLWVEPMNASTDTSTGSGSRPPEPPPSADAPT